MNIDKWLSHVSCVCVNSIRHEDSLFHANGSVYWQDDQNIALDFYNNYLISENGLLYELNASIISTIPQVSSVSGSFYHKQTNKRFDTNIHVQVRCIFITCLILMRIWINQDDKL